MSRNDPVMYDRLVALAEFTPESNAWALELSLEEAARLGRFEPIDAARVAAVRMLARAVDHDTTNAALWTVYRKALEELICGSGGDDDDPVARIRALSAAVRDTAQT